MLPLHVTRVKLQLALGENNDLSEGQLFETCRTMITIACLKLSEAEFASGG